MADYHKGWQEWLAANLMKGVDPTKIIQVMMANGFDREFVLNHIEEAKTSPFVTAGQKIFKSTRKLTSLFDTFSELYKQSGYAKDFAKHDTFSPSEFYSKYYYCNRPVAIRGLMQDWLALKLWTPDYFAEQFGESKIEITSDRTTDPRFEDNFTRHRKITTMKEYVRMVKEGGETNDYYLVAKNQLLSSEDFRILRTHFHAPKGFLDPSTVTDGYVKLWFGPKGTLTPLHHDAGNIFFGQVYGRKHIKLISPFDIERVYNDRTCFSAVDLENIDFEKYPLMRQVPIIDVILEPGEFLLLPVGWWHWVKSLDISISLSFQNFYLNGPDIVWKLSY